jgi:hypothetical protein
MEKYKSGVPIAVNLVVDLYFIGIIEGPFQKISLFADIH